MTKGGFDGFPRETVSFLSELAKNNDKAWFEERKGDYEQEVLEPARAFVAAMGERLKKISQGVVADPRRDKSIFRIYRDVRFGKGVLGTGVLGTLYLTRFSSSFGPGFWGASIDRGVMAHAFCENA